MEYVAQSMLLNTMRKRPQFMLPNKKVEAHERHCLYFNSKKRHEYFNSKGMNIPCDLIKNFHHLHPSTSPTPDNEMSNQKVFVPFGWNLVISIQQSIWKVLFNNSRCQGNRICTGRILNISNLHFAALKCQKRIFYVNTTTTVFV